MRDSWKEWNGRFRDDVRSFFRGDEGVVGRLADRLLGGPEIYGHEEREAEQSVNFVRSWCCSPVHSQGQALCAFVRAM